TSHAVAFTRMFVDEAFARQIGIGLADAVRTCRLHVPVPGADAEREVRQGPETILEFRHEVSRSAANDRDVDAPARQRLDDQDGVLEVRNREKEVSPGARDTCNERSRIGNVERVGFIEYDLETELFGCLPKAFRCGRAVIGILEDDGDLAALV